MTNQIQSPIRCLSSHLTTFITEKRNFHGRDVDWLCHEQGIGKIENYRTFSTCSRIISSTIPYLAMPLIASIETLVYTVLFGASLILFPVSKFPLLLSARLMSSSVFTILWNIGNVYFNVTYKNLFAHESLVRLSFDHFERGLDRNMISAIVIKTIWIVWGINVLLCMFTGADINLYLCITYYINSFLLIYASERTRMRLEDSVYINEWSSRNPEAVAPLAHLAEWRGVDGLNAVELEGLQAQIGAKFLLNEIFSRMDNKSIESIEEGCEVDCYQYLATICVYNYAFGSKRSEETLPGFFSEETKKNIINLRNIKILPAGLLALRKIMQPYENYLSFTEYQNMTDPLSLKIKEKSSYTIQDLLVKDCLKYAIEGLQSKSA